VSTSPVPVRLFFQDEARFGRINDPRRCWAPPGMRPDVPSQIVREYTYAFAAVAPHSGAMVSLMLPVANASAMSLFLDELAARHAGERLLVVLDGAGWHIANELRVPESMRLLRLPPYSPQLNPVESLWDELREKWFQNTVFADLGGLEDRLVEGLRSLEDSPALVGSVCGYGWIKAISLNAT
jgi:DDE superfamily endonuclease